MEYGADFSSQLPSVDIIVQDKGGSRFLHITNRTFGSIPSSVAATYLGLSGSRVSAYLYDIPLVLTRMRSSAIQSHCRSYLLRAVIARTSTRSPVVVVLRVVFVLAGFHTSALRGVCGNCGSRGSLNPVSHGGSLATLQ